MKSPLKVYKALATGAAITTGLVVVFSQVKLIFVNPAYFSTPFYFFLNVLALVLMWLGFSFLVYKLPVFKVLAVLGLLVVALVSGYYLDSRYNPVTIPLLVLFWLGLAYLILPRFFSKYRIAILSVYGAVLSYFLIFRMVPDYAEEYHQNFLKFLLVPLPVLAALWFFEQWRWLTTLKADKARAELTLLKNQIDPHFFFNTLNNLYGLAVEKSDRAPAMILKLSDIMRYTIYDGMADYVPLQNEVTYLEDYIDLHKIRYQRNVNISFQKNLGHPHEIAPLLLINPLENAFKHGVESQAESAFIEIEVVTTATSIGFEIRNSYTPKETGHKGIGLDNLKQRLALIYPNRHEIEILTTADVYTLRLKISAT